MVILWLVFTTIVAIFVLLYRHATRNFNYWKNQKVPYLPPIPIFGNMFKVATLQQSIGQFAIDLYNSTNAKYIGFFAFDQPFLLIRDPDVIKDVLVRDFEHFENRSIFEKENFDKICSNFLLFIKNPTWKSVRAKVTPIFTSGKIKSMLHLMIEESENLKAYIDEIIQSTNNGTIESIDLSMKHTTDVVSSCVLGINARSFSKDSSGLSDAGRKFIAFTVSKSVQMTSYFIAPLLAKLFRMNFLTKESLDFLQIVFLKQMYDRQTSKTKRGDLIDILLQLQKEVAGLDENVVVAQAIQFFLAGFDTTGHAITFTLYELALHKEIQSELRQEIKKTLAVHGKLTYEAIMDMTFLDNIISEALRKHPSILMVDRRCNKTYKIRDADVTIDKRIPIYISLIALHMDPKYFPEPEKFDPYRFSDKNKHKILPYTYMPFGDGPRKCIGSRFGLIVVKVALIAIFSNFEVEPTSSTPIPVELSSRSVFLISAKHDKIPLRFKKLK